MRLMDDKKLSSEILAMATIEETLNGLDEEAKGRVLRWVGERYRANVLAAPKGASLEVEVPSRGAAFAAGPEETGVPQFETFAELYAQAAPSTDANRVLVGAYWLQVVRGVTDLEARPINNELRNLGHAVGHMPSAFEALLTRRPQPMVQTRKTGKSKQATKRFKLTAEGKRAVERMLDGSAGE